MPRTSDFTDASGFQVNLDAEVDLAHAAATSLGDSSFRTTGDVSHTKLENQYLPLIWTIDSYAESATLAGPGLEKIPHNEDDGETSVADNIWWRLNEYVFPVATDTGSISFFLRGGFIDGGRDLLTGASRTVNVFPSIRFFLAWTVKTDQSYTREELTPITRKIEAGDFLERTDQLPVVGSGDLLTMGFLIKDDDIVGGSDINLPHLGTMVAVLEISREEDIGASIPSSYGDFHGVICMGANLFG
jgi:hypothetical protein